MASPISSLAPRHFYIAAALGAIVIALGALRLTPQVCGVYHDDAVYVSTAKSLAEGRGYRLINLPATPPPPQTKYPPLYAATLAGVWTLWPKFPANLIALQAVSLMSAALAVSLAYLYLIRFRYADSVTCALAAAICATSPSFIYFATQTLSESLFSLVLVANVWLLESGERSGRMKLREFSEGVMLTLPFLCRSVGICFYFPALVRVLKQSATALPYAAGALLAALPWVAWIAVNLQHAAGPAASYYTVENYVSWWAIDASVVRVALLNIFWVLTSIGALQVEGLAAMGFSERVAFLLLSLLLFTIIGGGVCLTLLRTCQRGGPLVLFFGAYLVVIVFWPWPPPRFVVPLTPLLGVFFLLFVQRLGGRVIPRRARISVFLVAVLVLCTNVLQQARIANVVRQTGYPYAGVPEERISWSRYTETFNWLKANVETDAVIASGLDTMVYLYTDRRSIRPFVQRPTGLYYMSGEPPLGTAAEFRSHLLSSGAGYLLELPMPGFREEQPLAQLIQETLASRPGCLRERFRLPNDSRFIVYAVVQSHCAD